MKLKLHFPGNIIADDAGHIAAVNPSRVEEYRDLLRAAPELLAALTRLANAVEASRKDMTILTLNELVDAEDAARSVIASTTFDPLAHSEMAY